MLTRNSLLFFVICFVCLVSASPANAHRPYLVKQGVLETGDGQRVIKEEHYGDGIMVADPVVYQIRSPKGAVLARSPVSSHIASFCPIIEFCWVFPYDPILPLSRGWRLNADVVYEYKEPVSYKMSERESDAYQDYLNDDAITSVALGGLPYPEHSDEEPFGFSPVFASVVVSPLAIILDSYIVLGMACLLPILFYGLRWLFFKYIHIKHKAWRRASHVLAVVLLIVYAGAGLASLLVVSFVLLSPWLYSILAMIVGVKLGAFLDSYLTMRFRR